MLASPSLVAETKYMEEDDLVVLTDPVDMIVPNAVPRDITNMGQKRKHTWV